MNIGFVTSLYMPSAGGAEMFLDRLVCSLQERGHSTVVIAPRRRETESHEPAYPLQRTFRPWSKRYFVGNAWPTLLYAHARHRFDVIHCHGEYRPVCSSYIFHRLTGVPYVCRALGSGFTTAEASPRLQRKMDVALSRVSLMFAQGVFLKNRMLEKGIPEQKIVVVNNGVRTKEIRTETDAPSPIESPYIFFAGGLLEVKGYDIMVRGFAKIAESFPEIKLVIVGSAECMNEFNGLLDELSLHERVLYLGQCDRQMMCRLFCHCILFASPYRRSPFSNANLEAMAAGRPIVATAVDGNCEQIRHGEEGFLVPVGDDVALAEALSNLLSDEALREKMGATSYERGHFYSWAKMVSRYEAGYEQAIGAVTGG